MYKKWHVPVEFLGLKVTEIKCEIIMLQKVAIIVVWSQDSRPNHDTM